MTRRSFSDLCPISARRFRDKACPGIRYKRNGINKLEKWHVQTENLLAREVGFTQKQA